MRRFGVVVLIVFAAVLAAELAIPWLVGSLVAKGMTGLTASDRVTAEVEKRPALLMFGGRFDSVRIRAADARVDKIVFAELDAVLRDVALDMGALLARKGVVVQSVRDVDLTAVITQEELGRYLNQSVKGIRNAKVTVNDGKVQVGANFILGQIASVAITLEGRITADGQRIKFVTDRFMLNNTMVGNIGGTVLTEVQLVDLSKLPFGVSARQVKMDNGRVTILADNRAK